MEALHWNVAACSIIPFGVREKERAKKIETVLRLLVGERASSYSNKLQDSPSVPPSGQKFRNAWTHIPGYGCRGKSKSQK
jgi:hypothetical protein